MKKKLLALGLTAVLSFSLSACGTTNPELSKFKTEIQTMCDNISALDNKINNIDPSSANATKDMLEYMDDLDMLFARFAEVDFPEEFDYLEPLTKEGSDYMKEAVKYYKDAFADGEYNQYSAEYAQANYERAYKRIKIIVSMVKGESTTE